MFTINKLNKKSISDGVEYFAKYHCIIMSPDGEYVVCLTDRNNKIVREYTNLEFINLLLNMSLELRLAIYQPVKGLKYIQ